jgi:uncharacterized protein with HEPN domain
VRDDRIRLGDVLEAIERIEKYTGTGRDALNDDELVQTWVVHHLMIIGESCRALSPEFRAGHREGCRRRATAATESLDIVLRLRRRVSLRPR